MEAAQRTDKSHVSWSSDKDVPSQHDIEHCYWERNADAVKLQQSSQVPSFRSTTKRSECSICLGRDKYTLFAHGILSDVAVLAKEVLVSHGLRHPSRKSKKPHLIMLSCIFRRYDVV